MKRRVRPPFQDRELIEMLASEPELLAIADGLVTTRSGSSTSRPTRRFRTRGVVSVLIACVAGIAALVFMLISPWQSNSGFVSRALAAVGNQPVLHVVFEQRSPDVLVNLRTGQPITRPTTTEIWFDRERGLKETVSSVNDRPFDQMLETPLGGFTEAGFVYTCAWIADHPVEAAAARVSCDQGMAGRSERLTQQRPVIDPALANFVDHYQDALRSGAARQVGRGRFLGKGVIWLNLEIPQGTTGVSQSTSEKVAVDATTYKPLLVSSRSGTIRVLKIETVGFDNRLFAKPPQLERPSVGSVVAESAVNLNSARALLGAPALWLGQEWQGLRLTTTKRQEVTTGYGSLSDRAPEHALGIEFKYARVKADGTVDSRSPLVIREASSCLLAYGWSCGATDPSAGMIKVSGPRSLLRIGPLYIAIWDFRNSHEPSVVAVARSLEQLSR